MVVFFVVLIYSGLLVLLSSEFYLVGGSNVIDFVFTVSMLAKIVSIVGLLVFGYLLIFVKYQKYLSSLMFLVAFLLSLVSAQSVVYSGKTNSINYYVYGIGVGEVELNPAGEDSIAVASVMPGLGEVSAGDKSFNYVSLFCPYCLDLTEIQGL